MNEESIESHFERLRVSHPIRKIIKDSILPKIQPDHLLNFFRFGLPATLKKQPSMEMWAAIANIIEQTPKSHRVDFFKHGFPALLPHAITAQDLHELAVPINELLELFPSFQRKVFLEKRLHHCLGQTPSSEHLMYQVEIAKKYLEKMEHSNLGYRMVAENFGRLLPHTAMLNRLAFHKEGSVLIPLGGSQTGIIIRVITREAFEQWKKAHDNGVAVEEIVHKGNQPRIVELQDGRVAVFSRFAGHQLYDFIDRHPEHEEEVRLQQRNIRKQLKKLEIEHGHDHDENYTGRMVHGRPVVRIIDFDEARPG